MKIENRVLLGASEIYCNLYRRQNYDSFAITCHLLITLIIFSPFFLSGGILVGSTDSLTVKLPMLLGARDDFWANSVTFWDRYTNAGSSLALCSTCPGIYAPENWIYYLLPASYSMVAMTIIYCLKFWLVGVFSYLLLREEVKNNTWALFSSIVLILSGRTIWALTTHENLTGLLCALIALYIFWTAKHRSLGLTALFLILTLSILTVSCTVNASAYWLLALCTLFIYRLVCIKNTTDKIILFVLACSTAIPAMILFSLRAYPLLADISDVASSALTKLPADLTDASRYVLRLFIPEVLGVNYHSSAEISRLFRQGHGSIDGNSRDFFGIVPIVILLTMPILATKKLNFRLTTLGAIVLFAFGLNYHLEPFETILRLNLGPFFHPSSIDHFMTIPFIFLFAHSGVLVERKLRDKLSPYWSLWAVGIFGFVLLYSLFLWLAVYASIFPLSFSQIVPITITMAIIVILLFCYVFGERCLKYWWSFPFILFFLTLPFYSEKISFILSLFWLGSISIVLSLFGFAEKKNYKLKRRLYGLAGTVGIIFLIAICIPIIQETRDAISITNTAKTAIIGVAKFLSALVMLGAIFIFFRNKKISKKQFVASLLLLFCVEQLVAVKVNSFRVLNPFDFHDARIFTPISDKKLVASDNEAIDLESFRTLGLGKLIQTPFYKNLYGSSEALTNFSYLYKVPSISGTQQTISKRYLEFAKALAPNVKHGVRSINTLPQSERFLDLTSVRYITKSPKPDFTVRESALPRFAAFKNWIVLPDSKTLAMLKNNEFNPHNTAIIAAEEAVLEEISFSSSIGISRAVDALVLKNRAWHSDPKQTEEQWIIKSFSKPVKMNELYISAQVKGPGADEHLRAPKDFILQASNDSKNWTEILKKTDIKYGENREPNIFSFDNKIEFQHYRLLLLKNRNDDNFFTVNQFNLRPKDKEIELIKNNNRATQILEVVDNGDLIKISDVPNFRHLLLFNDTYHPGWKAKVDGHNLKIQIVNHAFMGVIIPKGTVEVTLAFEPAWKKVISALFILYGFSTVLVVSFWFIFMNMDGNKNFSSVQSRRFKQTREGANVIGIIIIVSLSLTAIQVIAL